MARFEIRHDTARFEREDLEERFAMRTPPRELESGGASAGRYQCAVAWHLVSSMKGDFGLDVPAHGGFSVWFTLTLPRHEGPTTTPRPGPGAAPAASAPAAPAATPAPTTNAVTTAPAAPAMATAPRVPQEDLQSNLGPILELGADSAKIRRSRVPSGPVTVEIQGDERLALPAEVITAEPAGARDHEVVLRFVDLMPQTRQQVFRVAMMHRKH